ncbi:MAG: bifunctional glutamate N-acetyltransferase/amino-acid acetyltransferase ArgJ [Myxococcales bacterium]|nr:bifunctional glutamate N-acetyltransferase/amino-acid acetyltransferase ArgJ [Myxococcales bacterium]
MTTHELEWIKGGTVTSPAGFIAAGTLAGIKEYGPEPRLDVGLLASQRPAAAAGVFTRSQVIGAPVEVCRERLPGASIRGVVVNSGNSNVATGAPGLLDARRMTALAAERVGAEEEQLLVASTGVIGRRLDMAKIEAGIAALEPDAGSGGDFARAIMTTDTVSKSRALRVTVGDRSYTVGGAAKGSGMVHPDMATVLCFLTTDAPADPEWLQRTLRVVCADSLNMLDVDMDTSTSDTMLVLANGDAGGDVVDAANPAAVALTEALREVAIALTRELARDGEGAQTLIEVTVTGADNDADARRAARTVVASPLIKTMVTGRDANLGRVLMALGRSGASLELDRTSVYIGEHCAFERGVATDVPYQVLSEAMEGDEVRIRADLGVGDAKATAYGCDLTEQYIRINADYTT